jgi:hypothetical protein
MRASAVRDQYCETNTKPKLIQVPTIRWNQYRQANIPRLTAESVPRSRVLATVCLMSTFHNRDLGRIAS